MKFSLHIELGNDAMQTRSDVAAVLNHLADLLATDNPDCPELLEIREGDSLRDPNGNCVGEWAVS